MKGGGEKSHPVSSPGFCGRVGAARPRRGRGTSGPMAVNRSGPRQGRRPGLPPPRALPAPAAPSTPPGLPCPPRSPQPGPAWGRGRSGAGRGGAGVPRRRTLPRGSAQGEGLAAQGEGPRARPRGEGRTPAPQERGPRGASWVKSGRAAPGEPRGAEVRGQGPGVRRAGPPHGNAASGRNLFVFHRAGVLSYRPGCRRGAELQLCSAYPTPSAANAQPNSPFPLNSSQPPARGWQERSKFALTTSGGGRIYSSLSSPPPSPRLLTLLQTRTININMCHCNRAGNIRILRWGG